MTTAILTISQMKKNTRKIRTATLPQIDWQRLCYVGIFMCAALLLLYIYQINILTGDSYKLSTYKKTADQVSKENDKLEISFAESSFLGGIVSKAEAMNLKKVVSVKYIEVLDPSLANAK